MRAAVLLVGLVGVATLSASCALRHAAGDCCANTPPDAPPVGHDGRIPDAVTLDEPEAPPDAVVVPDADDVIAPPDVREDAPPDGPVCPPSGCNTIVQLAVAEFHVCGRRADGRVVCWGWDRDGRTGRGVDTNTNSPPMLVPGLLDTVAIGSGDSHTCAVAASGTVRCWGLNGQGQLGDGTRTTRTAPTEVAGLSDAVEVVAGSEHTCARRRDGTVWCWGNNSQMQLGPAGMGMPASARPLAVGDLTGITLLTAGEQFTCTIGVAGSTRCWGNNSFGQLGDFSTTDRAMPVPIMGVAGLTALTAGDEFTCARMGDGTARCWGQGDIGQLGDGTRSSRTMPADITSDPVIAGVSAGGDHACAWTTAGEVLCWGENDRGQLGDNTLTARERPTPIAMALGDVIALDGGDNTHCALRASGGVVCWGHNDHRQLGNAMVTTAEGRMPVVVLGLPP